MTPPQPYIDALLADGEWVDDTTTQAQPSPAPPAAPPPAPPAAPPPAPPPAPPATQPAAPSAVPPPATMTAHVSNKASLQPYVDALLADGEWSDASSQRPGHTPPSPQPGPSWRDDTPEQGQTYPNNNVPDLHAAWESFINNRESRPKSPPWWVAESIEGNKGKSYKGKGKGKGKSSVKAYKSHVKAKPSANQKQVETPIIPRSGVRTRAQTARMRIAQSNANTVAIAPPSVSPPAPVEQKQHRSESESETLDEPPPPKRRTRDVVRHMQPHNRRRRSPSPIPNERIPIAPRPPYTYRQRGVRVFRRTQAVDTTFEVRFDDQWQGRSLSSLLDSLRAMFGDILADVTAGLDPAHDLGRVVLHHGQLSTPIVVPLSLLHQLTPERILQYIQAVLNSHQNLSLDRSFYIDVGLIRVPRLGSRAYVNTLMGDDNSMHRKRSIIQITNDDFLCMPRAIAMCWARKNVVDKSTWDEMVRADARLRETDGENAGDRDDGDTVAKILRLRKVPSWFWHKLVDKSRNNQYNLALAIAQLAGVPTDRAGVFQDIDAYERALNVEIAVVSSQHGNTFVRKPKTNQGNRRTNPDIPILYLYTVGDITERLAGHVHSIASITGFFSKSYFCEHCMAPYSEKHRHKCNSMCEVCQTVGCSDRAAHAIECIDCNARCKSQLCFDRHKTGKQRGKGKRQYMSLCKRYKICLHCTKPVDRSKRPANAHKCGEYYCNTCKRFVEHSHQCFHRSQDSNNDGKYMYVFFDFETFQQESVQCKDGYVPDNVQGCNECRHSEDLCASCRICTNCKKSMCGQTRHIPNYAVAQTVCNVCEHRDISLPCKKCGTRCQRCKKRDKDGDYCSAPCAETCGQRQVIFEGRDTSDEFCRWAFSDAHKGATLFAHNMRSFDGYFLVDYLIRNSIIPANITYAGAKIMSLRISRGLNITLRDSLNFLPFRLAMLPKAFGLNELKKGHFPHLFNRIENQNYVGDFPPVETYGPDQMGSEEREQFLKWYREQVETGQRFDFRKEMKDYCISDTTILREACMSFRRMVISETADPDALHNLGIESVDENDTDTDSSNNDASEGEEDIINDGRQRSVKKPMTGIDPFKSSTIAGMCMSVFKNRYLEEFYKADIVHGESDVKETIDARYYEGKFTYHYPGHEPMDEEALHALGYKVVSHEFDSSLIGVVPPTGYCPSQRYSTIAIQWLEWLRYTQGHDIKHALNSPLGEVKIPGTDYTVDGYAEINGVKTCFEFLGDIWHGCHKCYPPGTTNVKHPFTRQSMSELYALTRRRQEAIEAKGYRYISIWECTFKQMLRKNQGGVQDFVNNLNLEPRMDIRGAFYGGRTNACRLYYKVDSTKGEYISYLDFTSLYPYICKYAEYPVAHASVIIRDFKPMKHYFGVAKVKILPPRGLYHPVLPYRSNGKLKFPLCGKCANSESVMPCACAEEERCLTGSWCTPELWKAEDMGYKIVTVYEVYHWDNRTKYDPLTGEGGLFAAYINKFLKFKQEASGWPLWCETEEDKARYIRNYYDHEGILLDYERICKNPALRSLSKLMLNNFWGKLGQRPNFTHSDMFTDNEPEKFCRLISDPSKELVDFHILNDNVIHVQWKYKAGFVPMNNRTNVFLAAFTTCWARLKLYEVLEHLGQRVLYFDTDSVIFTSMPYDPPVPTGDYLGQLTDELDGDVILEFASAGPKNYAYRTLGGKEVCKVRGFTLNHANSAIINFNSVKRLIVNHQTEPGQKLTTTGTRITRDRDRSIIYNRVENKDYRMVYTKRRILANLNTVPYGF